MAKIYTNIGNVPVKTYERFAVGDLMPAVFGFVIIIQYIYLFSFNQAPDVLRAVLSGVLALTHAGMAMVAIAFRSRAWNLIILAALAIMATTWLVAHGLGFGEVRGMDVRETLRKAALFLMFIWVLAYPMALPMRLLIILAILGILLGGAIALTGEPVYAGGRPRLGSITGGIDQMHPSARFIALQIILLDLLRIYGFLKARVAWPLVAFGVAILIGYFGRNELLFLAVYFGASLYFRFHKEMVIKWSIIPVAGIIAIAAIIALLVGTNVQDYGSGRIGTWQHRLNLIWDRDLITFLFGGGVKSDDIFTPQWDFGEAFLSHNDFIHYSMENGLLGLFALCAVIGALWARVPYAGKAIVLGVIVTSFFDNGFFQQPLLALNLAIVLALTILGWQLKHASTEPPDVGPAARI